MGASTSCDGAFIGLLTRRLNDRLGFSTLTVAPHRPVTFGAVVNGEPGM